MIIINPDKDKKNSVGNNMKSILISQISFCNRGPK